MTLVGIEKLQQWKYIFVFLSIPASLLPISLIVMFAVPHPALLFPVLGFGLFIVPYLVNKAVQKYYQERSVKNAPL